MWPLFVLVVKRYLAYFGQNVIMDKLTSILEYILIYTYWVRNVCTTILEYTYPRPDRQFDLKIWLLKLHYWFISSFRFEFFLDSFNQKHVRKIHIGKDHIFWEGHKLYTLLRQGSEWILFYQKCWRIICSPVSAIPVYCLGMHGQKFVQKVWKSTFLVLGPSFVRF